MASLHSPHEPMTTPQGTRKIRRSRSVAGSTIYQMAPCFPPRNESRAMSQYLVIPGCQNYHVPTGFGPSLQSIKDCQLIQRPVFKRRITQNNLWPSFASRTNQRVAHQRCKHFSSRKSTMSQRPQPADSRRVRFLIFHETPMFDSPAFASPVAS